MNGHTVIINRLSVLVQGISATDRWAAARDTGGLGVEIDLLWWIVLLLSVGIVVALIASVFYLRRQDRRKWEKFQTSGVDAGLREKELKLLRSMVKLHGLKDPSAIYTEKGAFNAAALHLMTTERVIAMSDKVQADLQGILISTYAKLGFGLVDQPDEIDGRPSSRRIEIGGKVFVSRMGETDSIEATVTDNNRVELVFEADQAVPGRRDGDVLTIRHAHEQNAWEFDARVIRCEGNSVSVEHSHELRAVNFRRFPRVAARMPGTGTAIPFHVSSCLEPLELAPVDVYEIAGPGLLVKMAAQPEVGQNLLIRVQLGEDRSVQGMAKVRRIVTDRPNGPFVAVEFVELDAEKLNELTRATNLAAGDAEESHSHENRKMAMA